MAGHAPILSAHGVRLVDPATRRSLLEIERLELHEGEILGLEGPSGAGKTLTALALTGLVREHGVQVEGGEVLFQGVDLLTADATADKLRGRGIGMLFQDPLEALDPARRSVDQLLEPLRGMTKDRRLRYAMICRALERAGLPATPRVLRAYPTRDLSGGERQRLLFALATVCEPEVLIADEPTTQLDAVSRLSLIDQLRERRDVQGLSCVLISHDRDLLDRLADRRVLLESGRIAAPDTRHKASNVDRSAPHFGASSKIALQVTGLTKSYGGGAKKVAPLEGVEFSLHAGESVGLIGVSGAGKTTLGRCLAGLIRPDGGRIIVDGPPTAYGHPRPVQMIFQDPRSSLDPLWPVVASVEEALAPQLRGSGPRVRAAALLEELGLPSAWHDRRPPSLSGGQCQRVTLARAFAARPRVIILDEPTTALDALTTDQVILSLAKLRTQEPEMACLVASHDLDLLARTCTRLLVLESGRIVEDGAIADIWRTPKSATAQQLVRAWPRLMSN